MTVTIWRFDIDLNQTSELSLRLCAPRLLHVASRTPNVVTVWIQHRLRVNVTDIESIELTVYGTGWEIPADRHYVGSAIDGEFVWHVYERRAT